MRNNAAYLPESPIVYIILPKSIRNRASFRIFVEDRMHLGKTGTSSRFLSAFAIFAKSSTGKDRRFSNKSDTASGLPSLLKTTLRRRSIKFGAALGLHYLCQANNVWRTISTTTSNSSRA